MERMALQIDVLVAVSVTIDDFVVVTFGLRVCDFHCTKMVSKDDAEINSGSIFKERTDKKAVTQGKCDQLNWKWKSEGNGKGR